MATKQLPSHNLPVDAVIAITYRCNLRCGKCNLWQQTDAPDLSPTLIDKLPQSLNDVNISGGEPFLHPDLGDIMRRALNRLPKAHFIISTGGWLLETQLKVLHSLATYHNRIGLAISLDGLAVTHDLERGRPGSFEMALATIKGARAMGFDDLRIAFTISPQNVTSLPAVLGLAKKLDVELSIALVHSSEHYFVPMPDKQKVDPKQLTASISQVLTEQLKSISPKTMARSYFLAALELFARTNERVIPCYAASDFFFMDPQGLVYSCNMLDTALGNLNVQSFEQIWKGEPVRIAALNSSECNLCWMVCSARTAIKRHKTKLATWAIKAKLGNPFIG